MRRVQMRRAIAGAFAVVVVNIPDKWRGRAFGPVAERECRKRSRVSRQTRHDSPHDSREGRRADKRTRSQDSRLYGD